MNYKHLSIDEREKILFYLAGGLSLCKIAQRLGRNKSTISRELFRNDKTYSPSKAQIKYQQRRKKSCPHKKLDNLQLFDLVRRLFLEEHLSPKQISGRLRFEAYPIQLSSAQINGSNSFCFSSEISKPFIASVAVKCQFFMALRILSSKVSFLASSLASF